MAQVYAWSESDSEGGRHGAEVGCAFEGAVSPGFTTEDEEEEQARQAARRYAQSRMVWCRLMHDLRRLFCATTRACRECHTLLSTYVLPTLQGNPRPSQHLHGCRLAV